MRWLDKLREWWNPLAADPCPYCSNPDRKKLSDCRWSQPGERGCDTEIRERLRTPVKPQ